jgi:hypothetical protein
MHGNNDMLKNSLLALATFAHPEQVTFEQGDTPAGFSLAELSEKSYEYQLDENHTPHHWQGQRRNRNSHQLHV